MSWWVAGATVVTTVGSSIASSNAAKKSADAQTEASLEQLALQREQRDRQIELLEPFRQLGVETGLEGITRLSTEAGQQQFLEDYYDTQQFQAQAEQLRRQQLAQAEAAGGLGATVTQNQLAQIAPQLGFQALQQQQQQYGQLTNLGLSAAGAQAGFHGQAAQGSYQALQNIGTAQAGAATAGFQGAAQGVGTGIQIGQLLKAGFA